MPKIVAQLVLSAFLINGFLCPCIAVASDAVDDAPAHHAHHIDGHAQTNGAGQDCPLPMNGDCCDAVVSASPSSKQAYALHSEAELDLDEDELRDTAMPASGGGADPPLASLTRAAAPATLTPVQRFDKQSK